MSIPCSCSANIATSMQHLIRDTGRIAELRGQGCEAGAEWTAHTKALLEQRTTNSVLIAHQKGVTVPRLVDSSFIVASFTVLEAPLQEGRHTSADAKDDGKSLRMQFR